MESIDEFLKFFRESCFVCRPISALIMLCLFVCAVLLINHFCCRCCQNARQQPGFELPPARPPSARIRVRASSRSWWYSNPMIAFNTNANPAEFTTISRPNQRQVAFTNLPSAESAAQYIISEPYPTPSAPEAPLTQN